MHEMTNTDYYKTLGIKPNDLKDRSEDDILQIITAHYRRKALRLHPDRQGGSKRHFRNCSKRIMS